MLEELASETPGARGIKVNVEDSPNLAAQYADIPQPSERCSPGATVVTAMEREAVDGRGCEREYRNLIVGGFRVVA